MDPDIRHRSFAPVVDADIRLLVLGSLPGARSLAEGRYYANPRNQFWHLISSAAGRDIAALDYEARLAALLAAEIGLWDVVESAVRAGSLDSAIRGERANDLASIIAACPRLRAIAFNGGRAARSGRRALQDAAFHGDLVTLPSSSPTPGRNVLGFAEKREIWQQLDRWLDAAPLR